jgi:hypothetical protein
LAADRGGGSGDRARRPRIVDGAVGAQPLDGGVDVRLFELAARQARPHLRLGELAAGEQFQASQVGAVVVAMRQTS